MTAGSIDRRKRGIPIRDTPLPVKEKEFYSLTEGAKMERAEDTICALATAAAEAGIGIIRISGEHALSVAGSLLRTKSGERLDLSKPNRVRYAFVYDNEEEVDEVLVTSFLAPHSYTGEDSVEISCHGGVLLLQKVLSLCVRSGARPAEPGEFTKRAFLNGRLDLSEAEAVSDLIHARSEDAIRAGLSQLRGSLSRKIREMRKILLEDDAYIEAALDDPEHISLEGFSERLRLHAESLLRDTEALEASFSSGRLLREGIRTVIVGKPNAGKSSLLNALLGEERAIVTEIEGTTRDTLEEELSLKDLNLRVIDTAGIRETEDPVERIGVERARRAAEDADLIIYVVDASRPLDNSDEEILRFLPGKKALLLLNKSDLRTIISEEEMKKRSGCPVLSISARTEEGISMLSEKIREMFFGGELRWNQELIICSERQRKLLQNAGEALRELCRSIEIGMPEDFYTIDIMRAYEELGQILGERVSEDLIDEIFSKFCMGK